MLASSMRDTSPGVVTTAPNRSCPPTEIPNAKALRRKPPSVSSRARISIGQRRSVPPVRPSQAEVVRHNGVRCDVRRGGDAQCAEGRWLPGEAGKEGQPLTESAHDRLSDVGGDESEDEIGRAHV